MPSTTTEANGSFDELLGAPLTPAEKSVVPDLQDGGVPVETPEQIRMRELEAQIAELTAEAAAKPAEKSTEQKALEHNQAVKLTRDFNAATEKFETVDEDDPNVIVFHITDAGSGFTFAGKVWWVGQTVKIKKDGQAYESTVDRFGESWLEDLSPQAQFARWGKVVVGTGPWPGKPFTDAISQEDSFRQGAAPVVVL